MVHIEYIEDIVQCSIYLTIGNLSHEIWKSLKNIREMIIEPIYMYKKDSLKVKIKIYHQTLAVIIKSIFKSFLLYIIVWLGTALKKMVVKGVLRLFANKTIQQCYLVIINMSINYKEQF